MKDTLKAFPWKIHPYSILVTIGLDLVWAFVEVGFLGSLIGVLGYPCLVVIIFLLCAFSVASIQQSQDYDDRGVAWTKGIVLAVFAAVPFSITTLCVGFLYKVIQLLVGGDKVWLTGLLTTNWAALEGRLRDKARGLGFNGGQATMEEVINFLGSRGAISSLDVSRLHRLRQDRNMLSHTGQLSSVWGSARQSEVLVRKFSRRL
jgi:hypothetical protein